MNHDPDAEPETTTLSRRRLLLGVAGLGLSALLIACGSDDDEPEPTATAAPEAGPTATADEGATDPTATSEPAASAYPVTIDHKFGSTTIEAFPERVVVVGLNEQDALLALGVVPVATTEWFGGYPGAIFPWSEHLLGDAELPMVFEGLDLQYEQIAALKPDVIIGLYSGMYPEEYETLSAIAPTVAQPEEYVDWGIPWQELTLKVGSIVGKREEAEALVAEAEQSFVDARAAHPEFEGKTGAVGAPWTLPENYYVYTTEDVRGRIMTALGFEIPEIFDELADGMFSAEISGEQLDLIADLDVMVWVSNSELLDSLELYQTLTLVKEGRTLYYDEGDPVYDAFNFGTVVSMPYLVEQLVPDLVLALDGDPET